MRPKLDLVRLTVAVDIAIVYYVPVIGTAVCPRVATVTQSTQ